MNRILWNHTSELEIVLKQNKNEKVPN